MNRCLEDTFEIKRATGGERNEETKRNIRRGIRRRPCGSLRDRRMFLAFPPVYISVKAGETNASRSTIRENSSRLFLNTGTERV
jgi:hypothetical protein